MWLDVNSGTQEDDSLSCSYGLRVSETREALRSAARFVDGGGVLLVTPGWDRGEGNQRMGEGQRKASSGPDPLSVVPPLGDPLCTSSITVSAGAPPPPSPLPTSCNIQSVVLSLRLETWG